MLLPSVLKNAMSFLYRVSFVLIMSSAFGLAHGASSVKWANWTAVVIGNPGSAVASIDVNGSPIDITYNGEVYGGGGTNTDNSYPSWGPTGTFSGGTVGNTPPLGDMIALIGGSPTVNTIFFSRPVTNPVVAIWSLGNSASGASFVFKSLPLSIQSSGQSAEYPGFGGPLTSVGNTVSAAAEGNGVVQFFGTFTSISWSNPQREDFFGFTVGVSGEPDPSLQLRVVPKLSASDSSVVEADEFHVTGIRKNGSITLYLQTPSGRVYREQRLTAVSDGSSIFVAPRAALDDPGKNVAWVVEAITKRQSASVEYTIDLTPKIFLDLNRTQFTQREGENKVVPKFRVKSGSVLNSGNDLYMGFGTPGGYLYMTGEGGRELVKERVPLISGITTESYRRYQNAPRRFSFTESAVSGDFSYFAEISNPAISEPLTTAEVPFSYCPDCKVGIQNNDNGEVGFADVPKNPTPPLSKCTKYQADQPLLPPASNLPIFKFKNLDKPSNPAAVRLGPDTTNKTFLDVVLGLDGLGFLDDVPAGKLKTVYTAMSTVNNGVSFIGEINDIFSKNSSLSPHAQTYLTSIKFLQFVFNNVSVGGVSANLAGLDFAEPFEDTLVKISKREPYLAAGSRNVLLDVKVRRKSSWRGLFNTRNARVDLYHVAAFLDGSQCNNGLETCGDLQPLNPDRPKFVLDTDSSSAAATCGDPRRDAGVEFVMEPGLWMLVTTDEDGSIRFSTKLLYRLNDSIVLYVD